MPAEEARLYLVAAFFVPREGGFFNLFVYFVKCYVTFVTLLVLQLVVHSQDSIIYDNIYLLRLQIILLKSEESK